jgi:hypothetical protein
MEIKLVKVSAGEQPLEEEIETFRLVCLKPATGLRKQAAEGLAEVYRCNY